MNAAKVDLTTAIGVGIVGILVAFFVCNMFLGEPEDVDYKTIEGAVTTTVAEPDENVFNYKALNPTVEVFVGNDARGEQ